MKMTALVPMLPVQSLARAVEFYCEKLEFQVERRRDELDVTFYGHTEFRLDDPDGNRLWTGQGQQAAG